MPAVSGRPFLALPVDLEAEFLGTMVLVVAVICNAWGAQMFAVTSIAFTLMVAIYALADVSGSNFNPAVSLCLGLTGNKPWGQVVKYSVIQIIGGIAGGIIGWQLCSGTYQRSKAPKLGTDSSILSAVICEIIYTAMLCFVVLNTAVAKRSKGNNYYGLAIVLTIVAGGGASGPISGGLLNPAVGLGIMVPSGILNDNGSLQQAFTWLVATIAAQVLGAALAAGMFRLVHPEDFSDDGNEENHEPGLIERIASEFIGVFYLVFTVVLTVNHGSHLAVWAIAASLTSMIYALGNVSGAHFNPAVTLSISLRGNAVPHALFYVLAQILGGITGAGVGAYITGVPNLQIPDHSALLRALDAELIFTFLLCFVVLCIATVDGKDLRDTAALAVGSCVTGGGFAVGRISGGFFNPAVTIGVGLIAAIHGRCDYFMLIAYCITQVMAGGLAVVVFKGTRADSVAEEKQPLAVGANGEQGYAAAKLSSVPAAQPGPSEP